MKKILALIACLYLTAHLTACTSQEEAPNPEQQPVAEGGLENPNGAQAAGGDAQKPFLDQSLPENTLGEAPPALPPTDETAALPPVDSSAPVAAATTESAPKTDPTPSALGSMMDSTPSQTGTSASASSSSVSHSPVAPLQKVKDATYREGDQLINAVYIARPKDSYKSISSMIYGSEDKVKDLKAANPSIKKVKAGQKIYYNSPKRATDESKIMNYYEESGMPAETYVAKKDDNLKKISKELLGYPDAWKEIWMTNASIESKGKLNEGTEIKYWKGAASSPPAQQLAADGMKQPAPMPQEVAPPPPTQAQADLPPPPPPQQAQANLPPPPPPPPPTQAQADLPPPPPPQQAQANLPPPPPPPPEAAPPPPPPPQMAKKQPKIAGQPPAEEGAMDDQTMMAMAAAGIIIAAIAALIIIRKKKAQKAAASSFEQMGA